MSKDKLYIIGNGFDIFHGIRSRYSDFRDYVQKSDPKLFKALEEYFNPNDLWSDFEETLASLDTDKIVDDASNFLVSYGVDDWSDSYHHDYQFEVKQAINIVTVHLKNHFTRWILSLEITPESRLNLSHDAYYITFNYTPTLEMAYDISADQITHLHNKAIDENSTLILGHSRQVNEDDLFTSDDDEDTDVRVAEGNRMLDEYFETTYKNTETIIAEQHALFESLKETKEVFVLGHSMSPVDIKYFEVIAHSVAKDALWKVSYYGEDQKTQRLEILNALGIAKDKIRLIQLTDLQDKI